MKKRYPEYQLGRETSPAKSCGFDFVEMSVDENDERLARTDWSLTERMELISAIQQTGIRIPTMCLSAHRRFPFGSHDRDTRQQARTIMLKALRPRRIWGFEQSNWQAMTFIMSRRMKKLSLV